MDELKESIAKTNDMLAELLRRQDARMAESEARLKEFKDRMPSLEADTKKAADEHGELLREIRNPDHEKRMEEIRSRAEETVAKQKEFQETTIRMMEEQNALLRSILEKLS